MEFYEELKKLDKQLRDNFDNLERRLRKNEVISGNYEALYEAICNDPDFFRAPVQMIDVYGQLHEVQLDCNLVRRRYAKHVRKSKEAVKSCRRWYEIDYYPLQGYKDIKKTFSCNSKFCEACQSAISKKRFERFSPILEELQRVFDVAHVVFTVPNCVSADLKITLDKMYEARKYLLRYLSGRKKVRGIDFEKYGFEGGVVALEITTSEDGTLHPHFHCAFIFKKGSGVFKHRRIVNAYSFDKKQKKEVHLFNDFEILLQKVWRLRFDGIEVNRNNIENMPLGYDVYCERRENFHEVFKYVMKGMLKWDKDVQRVVGFGSLTDFVHMDYSLYCRRVISSYGILRGISIPDTVDQSKEGDDPYVQFVEKLHFLETPIEVKEHFETLLAERDNKNIKFFSRKSIQALLSASEDE